MTRIRKSWNGNIWDLSHNELIYGIGLALDSLAFKLAMDQSDPLIVFAFDSKLVDLAGSMLSIWHECDGDKTLMKLKLL